MSGCDPLRVHALHDGTLGAESRAEAVRHLTQCAECTDALAELRALDALATEEPEVPEGYFDQLPARIMVRARRPRGLWSRPATWAGAIAAALLIAVVTPRLLDRSSSVPDRERGEPSLTAPTATAPRPQAVEPPPPATPTAAIPDRQLAPAAAPASEPTPAAPTPQQRKREVAVASAEARRAEATTTPTETAAAPPPAAPALERAAPALAADEAEGLAGQAAPVVVDAVAPQAMQKSAAAPRAAGRAAAPAPSVSPQLAQARAERDRHMREAKRAGSGRAPLRRGFDAAAEAVRAGGDESDRAALRQIAAAYLAALGDVDEKARVARVLVELGLR